MGPDRVTEHPWIVTWHRASNVHGPIIRLWAAGATLLVIGCLLMGLAMTDLVRPGSLGRILFGLAGFTCVVIGPTWTAVGITRRMLRDDDALLILRNDGVVYQLAPDAWQVAWAALDDIVVLDDGHGLELHTDDGRVIAVRERFDASFTELARELESTRRRALMGLLRRPEG